jgi:hypothetical protein
MGKIREVIFVEWRSMYVRPRFKAGKRPGSECYDDSRFTATNSLRRAIPPKLLLYMCFLASWDCFSRCTWLYLPLALLAEGSRTAQDCIITYCDTIQIKKLHPSLLLSMTL